jgi:murein DD-endopeptidase MepM/ murein hydrolase activator NlpD
MTRYAHLAKVNVKKGDPIKRGQLIGIRGGSGSRSDKDYDIHLHHEVIVNGNPVDPRSVLPKPGPPNV